MYIKSISSEDIEKLEYASFPGKITVIDSVAEGHRLRYGDASLFRPEPAEVRSIAPAAVRSGKGLFVQGEEYGNAQAFV